MSRLVDVAPHRSSSSEVPGNSRDQAGREFSPRRFRVLVLDWNGRSRGAARSVGFEEEGTILSTEGTFVVMTRARGRIEREAAR